MSAQSYIIGCRKSVAQETLMRATNFLTYEALTDYCRFYCMLSVILSPFIAWVI